MIRDRSFPKGLLLWFAQIVVVIGMGCAFGIVVYIFR